MGLDDPTGEDLGRHVARRGPLKLGPALEAFAGVADALDLLHERGEVICDLEPANLVVCEDGTLDLPPAGGAPAGSHAYAAPERFDGGEATPATDRYALGAVFFFALTGQPPVAGGNQAEVMANLMLHGPRRADEVAPAVPVHAADALAVATARDPAGRFTSAAQMMRALRGEETVEPPTPRKPPAAAPRDPSKGTPLQWLGFLIAVAVVVGIVLVKLSGMQAPPDLDETVAPTVVPARGGTLRVGTGGALEGLDPITSLASSQAAVHPFVYDTLVELDRSGAPVPSLAQTWTVSNGYTRYEFRIRKGVRFHPDPCLPEEGHELDARDVRATLERVLLHIARDPGGPGPELPPVQGIDAVLAGEADHLPGITLLDPHTLEVLFTGPAPDFLHSLARPPWSVVPQEALAEYGPGELGFHAVGTGPYRLVHAEEGATPLTLVRFEEGWHRDAAGGPLPYLDRIELHAYDGRMSAQAALREGEVDLLVPPYGETLDETAAASPAVQGLPETGLMKPVPECLRELWLAPSVP